MPNKIRRVVTGHDASGKAVVLSDDMIESREGRSGGTVHVTNLWMTDQAPATLDGPDPLAGTIPMLPVKDGYTFRVMELGPGTKPHMHRTETLDYIMIMEGELEMYLDDGAKVQMKEGDIMIQRATMHGWANPGTRPCRFVTIIVDAGGKLYEG